MPPSPALPPSRRDLILRRVEANGEVRVVDLASDFKVSAITVRRDLAHLAAEGLLEQVRGGARPLPGTRTAVTGDTGGTADGSRPRTGGSAWGAGSTASRSTRADRPSLDLAVLIPSLTYYWPTVLRGASEAADALGVRLHIEAASATASDNLLALDRLRASGHVDGMLFAPDLRSGAESAQVVEAALTTGIPTVLVERSLRDLGPTAGTSDATRFDTIRTDHRFGAFTAFVHLHGLGHRRLGLLRDPATPTVPRVVAGWEEAADALDVPEPDRAVGAVHTHGPDATTEIDEFLDLCLDQGIRALHVHSDEAALLVMQQAQRRGLSVPDEFSITAHDDELATLARPPLTAVAPPKETIGAQAVRMLVDRIEDPSLPVQHTELLPAFTVRGSTAPPSAG